MSNPNELLTTFLNKHGLLYYEAASQMGISSSLIYKITANLVPVSWNVLAAFRRVYCQENSPFFLEGAERVHSIIETAMYQHEQNTPQAV